MLLSLVIPTYGIVEWVLPVLDSIFNQTVDESLYEVVVTDNGNNKQFQDEMIEYCKKHKNLVYKKTTAVLFMNQIEAFKLASGEFIKFINHRTKLLEGSLEYLIQYIKENMYSKPISFFLNGTIEPQKKEEFYSDFDSFLYGLSFYSSWSGGVACWKTDLKKILDNDIIEKEYSLFPHACLIFLDEKDRTYNIDTCKLFEEIDKSASLKGRYDLFYAFGVEYIDLIVRVNNKGMIDDITKHYIKNENEKFIVKLYTNYVLLKNDCSYDLSSAKVSLNKYYSYNVIRIKALLNLVSKVPTKIKKMVRGNCKNE